ncbi:uncharacterized protein HMPREF1541_05854 [Cyphellophora europaea CBS 101466]|uniref:Protein kinase domain-containing protein n=1 Tax=Cyphellophora europaea (strain CBS 101466) TaxID=1220924 RepID=W2RV31_CYPE1|nr:uncharacterized protein HMPREF1541_05854 [Cyphellophora europaea CBS 101466]ETN39628.1 hypothetical protein HMPREF1541_05854 [Cyphellophora europaea CBS 101466]
MAFFQRAASGHAPGAGYLARLTKLYSDTKQSYESLTLATNAKAALEQQRPSEADSHDDAEVRELRRDFQIQQDRLLAWGISWSESGEDTESFREGGEKSHAGEKDIDRQIEKAGLGEVVASVMSQIKELLDQSGRLQHPERYEAMGVGKGTRPKKEWSQHEVKTGRVLLEQLTTCIDVLYSLSEGKEGQSGSKEKEKEARREKGRGLEDDVEEAYGFRRTQSPKPIAQAGEGEKWHPLYVEFNHIDFESGTGFGMADPPPYDADYVDELPRERKVGILRGQNKPILVEFLTPDIPPYVIGTSDDVFELHELGEKLCRQRKSLSWCGHLRLVGFTVAQKGPRCGIVYELPTGVGHQQLLSHRTLESAITATHNQDSTQPNLEDRFRLAYNLMVSVLGYFANGDSHRHVNSSNILLIGKEATPHHPAKADTRCPFLVQSCQDLVAQGKATEPLASAIYRHPAHDPLQAEQAVPAFDIYSLGLLLLEVGLWIPLTKLWKAKYDRRIFMARVQQIYTQKLAAKCGTKYMRLVQRCLHAPAELLGRDQPEDAGALLLEVSKELRLCLALDEEGMPPTTDLETFELLIIEQMCKTEERRNSNPEPSTSLPPLQIPGSQKPERQYSGTTKAGADAVRRKPLRVPSSDAIPMPVEAKAQEKKKKRSASSQLKKWPELQIDQQDLDQWNTLLMPRLRKILEDALGESPESCSVSLMKIGATPEAAKTTICVQCQNTAKVHETLRKRFKPKKGWGVVILKGDVHRSGQHKARRSGGRRKAPRKPKEQKYQEKPTCGASIGAFRDNEHLPPCSFGGTVLVDGEPFGMTVHHMLDAPSDSEDEDEYSSEEEENKPKRSAARGPSQAQLSARISSEADFGHMEGSLAVSDEEVDLNSDLELSPDEGDDMLELSDTESEASTIRPDYAITDDSGTDHWFLDDSSDTTTPSLIADDFSDEEDEDFDDSASIGDKPAVVPYSLESEELAVTQPALDDVDEDFFPSEEDRDEDHLASHAFGRIHASSGIRRVTRGMLKHEIDWALIRIEDERLDVANLIASSFSASNSPKKPSQPCKVPGSVEASAAAKQIRDSIPTLTSITPANKLSGLPVSCHARSSGFTSGRISQAMCLVKLHGRRSFSYSWCVDSTPSQLSRGPSVPMTAPQRSIAALNQMAAKQHVASGGILGVPGDSGAWVYNPNTGELAGHVLAYGEKLKQAYIAPMEVLFEDIKARLGAARVELPGGAGVVCEDEKENIDRQIKEVSAGLKQLGIESSSKRSSGTETGNTMAGAKNKDVNVNVGVGDVDVPPAVGRVAVAGSSC